MSRLRDARKRLGLTQEELAERAGLAHHLLGCSRAHTHADVWRLTLALAWPVRRFRRGLPSLDIPVWAQELRTLILAESRLITAA